MNKLIKYTLCAYIISLFIFNNIAESTNYVSMILLIIVFSLILVKISREKSFFINRYFLFYLGFTILGMFSYFYTVTTENVISKLIQLVINLIIILICVNIINSKKNIYFLLKIFAISGCIVSALLIFTSDYINADTSSRLGGQLGNVNSIAIQLCYSISALLILKKEWKNKYYILMEIMMIIAILFTGSRKGILMIILLYGMSYFLKNYNNLSKTLKNIIWSIIIISIIIFIIFNNSFLYNIAGVRLKNMFDFIKGDRVEEGSINIRSGMIKQGIEWFKQKPINGYGLDTYKYLYMNKYGINYYAHNNYIELLVDLGIIGTVYYYIIYMKIMKDLIKIKLYKDYKSCIFFVMIVIQILMDYASVSYSNRIMIIYITTICSYIDLYKKGEMYDKNDNDNNVDI